MNLLTYTKLTMYAYAAPAVKKMLSRRLVKFPANEHMASAAVVHSMAGLL